jgi:hypothetical protein
MIKYKPKNQWLNVMHNMAEKFNHYSNMNVKQTSKIIVLKTLLMSVLEQLDNELDSR